MSNRGQDFFFKIPSRLLRSEQGFLFLVGAFLAGFTSLLYQNYGIHVLFLFFPRSSQLLALAVSTFLAGLGFSALLFGRWVRNDFGRAQKAIIAMQVIVLFYAYFVCADMGFLPRILNLISKASPQNWTYSALIYFLIFLFLFIPAFGLGGAFPIFNGLYARSVESVVVDTAKVYFWDIAGSVVGCLITGFVLIPYLGIRLTILLAMLASLLIIILIKPHSLKTLAACTAAAFAFVYSEIIHNPLKDEFERRSVTFTRFPRFRGESIASNRFGQVVFHKESPYGTVRVGRKGDTSILFINLREICDDSKDFPTDDLIDAIAVDNVEKGASVLNIGLGCGQTAHVLSQHRNVSKLLVAEINRAVLDAYNAFFNKTFPLRDNNKVAIEVLDGSKILREGRQIFDAIVIDVEEVDIIYSSPLYTLEYMRMARARLKPGGVFAIWTTLRVSDDFLKVLYNTIQAAFNYAEMLIVRQKDNDGVIMYGSGKELRLGDKVELDVEMIKKIKSRRNNLLNTMEQPNLQRYYEASQNFALPGGY